MADSGCFGLGELPAGHARRGTPRSGPASASPSIASSAARAARLESHDPDGLVPAAVTPGIALGLAEGPQSSHGHTLRRTSGRFLRICGGRIRAWPAEAKEFRYAIGLDRARAASRPTDARRSTSTPRGRRSTWFSPASCAARCRACASTRRARRSTSSPTAAVAADGRERRMRTGVTHSSSVDCRARSRARAGAAGRRARRAARPRPSGTASSAPR